MLHVIDYSPVYFELFEETSIPQRRDGKFVFLTNSDDEFAVFAPRGMCSLHAHIVRRFLQLRKVPMTFDAVEGVCRPLASAWSVHGGGMWEFDGEAGILKLSGVSHAYGNVDLSQMARSIREAGGFTGLQEILIL